MVDYYWRLYIDTSAILKRSGSKHVRKCSAIKPGHKHLIVSPGNGMLGGRRTLTFNRSGAFSAVLPRRFPIFKPGRDRGLVVMSARNDVLGKRGPQKYNRSGAFSVVLPRLSAIVEPDSDRALGGRAA